MNMPETVRDWLFRDMHGCSDGDCIITGKASGMHTNGGCHCIHNLSRGQLSILASRIRVIADQKFTLPHSSSSQTR